MSLLGTVKPSVSPLEEAFAPRPKRWTVDEYDRAIAAGVFDGMRVELIDGEIIEMAPMGTSHASALCLVQAALASIFSAASYTLRNQCPLKLAESEPQPDAAVVAGTIRSITSHPTTALLVVEISDTSINVDQVSKLAGYALPMESFPPVLARMRAMFDRCSGEFGYGVIDEFDRIISERSTLLNARGCLRGNANSDEATNMTA